MSDPATPARTLPTGPIRANFETEIGVCLEVLMPAYVDGRRLVRPRLPPRLGTRADSPPVGQSLRQGDLDAGRGHHPCPWPPCYQTLTNHSGPCVTIRCGCEELEATAPNDVGDSDRRRMRPPSGLVEKHSAPTVCNRVGASLWIPVRSGSTTRSDGQVVPPSGGAVSA